MSFFNSEIVAFNNEQNRRRNEDGVNVVSGGEVTA
jgi:hypothetical protein